MLVLGGQKQKLAGCFPAYNLGGDMRSLGLRRQESKMQQGWDPVSVLKALPSNQLGFCCGSCVASQNRCPNLVAAMLPSKCQPKKASTEGLPYVAWLPGLSPPGPIL